MKKKSTIQWIADFASIHKKIYVFSVVFAVLGVFCALAPYFVIGNIVKELLSGRKEFPFYLNECLWLVLFWTARVLFHAASTTLSHKATFHVLATIRQRVCDKLYKLPLGYVCNTSSGGIKNVIVERIDSIETTLAHILPEFTGNLLGPLFVIIYLFTIDWRMALLSLTTLPIGMLCYMGMCIGYEESYKNTIIKTKILNDTAVEYINGIEVIKAFGKAESSYEKFVISAKEGAACFVEWMRRCNILSERNSFCNHLYCNHHSFTGDCRTDYRMRILYRRHEKDSDHNRRSGRDFRAGRNGSPVKNAKADRGNGHCS